MKVCRGHVWMRMFKLEVNLDLPKYGRMHDKV